MKITVQKHTHTKKSLDYIQKNLQYVTYGQSVLKMVKELKFELQPIHEIYERKHE